MEPLAFALWSAMAPRPDQGLLEGLVGVNPYEFVAGDGKTLRGYLIQARKDRDEIIDNPRGYVLIAPGNAMAATHLAADFVFLSALGYDVYILDYRGYGNSEGKRRLLAMTVDYEELTRHLSARYPHTYLLGLSLGGIVILKATHEGTPYTRAIVDSSPSTVTQFACPEAFNPVENLPEDASQMLFITGGRDRVIPPEASAKLVSRARASGAQVFRCEECGHPLMDADPELRERRFREIARFFAETDDRADR
jgi:alpha-beta hydrolase superfamily lysophospholipase